MDKFELGESDNRIEPLGPIHLDIGERFLMTIVGYDLGGLYYGWGRGLGDEESYVRVRIEESLWESERPRRFKDFKSDIQCGDVVRVEITKLAEKSAFAEVVEKIGCCFDLYTDSEGNFSDSYQKGRNGKNRTVILNGHSFFDTRNALSLGGPKYRQGFRGVDTLVRRARHSEDDIGNKCEIILDKCITRDNGKYQVIARPAHRNDTRKITKEIWLAQILEPHLLDSSESEPDLDYKGVYNMFKGFPYGLDGILYFRENPRKIEILGPDGKDDISGKKHADAVDAFYDSMQAPNRYRLAVTTPSAWPALHHGINYSDRELTIEFIPKNCYNRPGTPDWTL